MLALDTGKEFETQIGNEIDELSSAHLKISIVLIPRLYFTQLKMTP